MEGLAVGGGGGGGVREVTLLGVEYGDTVGKLRC